MRIGYARVSTAYQNPDLQEDALQKAGCEKIFRDVASGAVDSRSGLAEAIEYARDGDTLVVWKLDRLGRSLKHLIETVNGLAARKIGFQSLRESMDTTTSGGKLIFHVFGALAEFERELIRERTQAGFSKSISRGKPLMRMSPAPCPIRRTKRSGSILGRAPGATRETGALHRIRRGELRCRRGRRQMRIGHSAWRLSSHGACP
jgi:DNA invertase Pin-like site-specific DNA recombinase